MPSVCFAFEVHQPCRLRPYSFFELGSRHDYEDTEKNRTLLRRIAYACYLPMNALLLDLIERYQGKFRVTFSLTGSVLEQFRIYAPEVLTSFQQLAHTGCVEFMGETDCHSLACLFSDEEFRTQIHRHRKLIQEYFGQTPRAFRNTELIYNDHLAHIAEDMGYSVILAEGTRHILDWRAPHYVYQPQGCSHLQLLLRNYSLSDDIAFRFSNKSWSAYPLMAETFAQWLHGIKHQGEVITLSMDYECFGEHQWSGTGIFDFMRALPEQIFKDPSFDFLTVSEASARYPIRDILSMPAYTSWADKERDLSAWLGNDMQKDAFRSLYECSIPASQTTNPELRQAWRMLQSADHLYYMSTKGTSDGSVHAYFSPYSTPFEAYTNFMNILADFRVRLLAETRQ
jgi:alpha-amylase